MSARSHKDRSSRKVPANRKPKQKGDQPHPLILKEKTKGPSVEDEEASRTRRMDADDISVDPDFSAQKKKRVQKPANSENPANRSGSEHNNSTSPTLTNPENVAMDESDTDSEENVDGTRSARGLFTAELKQDIIHQCQNHRTALERIAEHHGELGSLPEIFEAARFYSWSPKTLAKLGLKKRPLLGRDIFTREFERIQARKRKTQEDGEQAWVAPELENEHWFKKVNKEWIALPDAEKKNYEEQARLENSKPFVRNGPIFHKLRQKWRRRFEDDQPQWVSFDSVPFRGSFSL